MTKKIFKVIGIILLAIVILVGVLLAWLSITEFKPQPVEDAQTSFQSGSPRVAVGDDLTVMSWNIGYAGLGEGSDFFMDGGSHTKSADEAAVNKYLDGIKASAAAVDADIYMFQEVDENSSRTYAINEKEVLAGANSAYALNYSCRFVPYPLPPIGRVNSGLFTTTDLAIDKAERVSLPVPFKWPVSTANLKRCLLVSYMPIENSDKQLVIVNLHLEAYDNGEGKIAQTKQLKEFIQAEYEKGNYVIAGGDFNQEFPGALEAYPNITPDLWAPGTLEENMLPEGWEFTYDLTNPTCRLLNQPYDPADTENTQHYVIDGFILSPNIEVKAVESIDLGFKNSDHNPVKLEVTLLP